jgi:hypothetical protein
LLYKKKGASRKRYHPAGFRCSILIIIPINPVDCGDKNND